MVAKELQARPIDDTVFYCMKPLDQPRDPLPAAYKLERNGRKIALVAGVVFGGPQTAVYVEEMRYLGIETIIGITIAGGISDRLREGEHFYIDRVRCADGVSQSYYAPGTLLSCTYFLEDLRTIARQLGIELKAALGVSVDTLYNETPQLIEKLRRQEIDVVNLEIGAFVSTCLMRGVKPVMFGYVSDSFEQGAWTGWYWDRSRANKQSVDMLVRVVDRLAA